MRCPVFKSPADKAASPRQARQEQQDILTFIRKAACSDTCLKDPLRKATFPPPNGNFLQSRLASFSVKAAPESSRDRKSTFKCYSHPMSHSPPHPVLGNTLGHDFPTHLPTVCRGPRARGLGSGGGAREGWGGGGSRGGSEGLEGLTQEG
uniref:Uncharacterized protein n=1 Tax=Pipistrellus kuhlii TaxID=59472 RepID=A0A7J7XV19_PIPKU|nr:hypothetical protein mPipKuh1_010463 [Pipistrellus kuhlii]